MQGNGSVFTFLGSVLDQVVGQFASLLLCGLCCTSGLTIVALLPTLQGNEDVFTFLGTVLDRWWASS
jgi:hypothetical protein